MQNLKVTTKHLRSLWISFVGMFRNPDRLWQIILAFMFCVTLVIVTMAVIASQWAMNVDTDLKEPPKKSDTLSLAELDAVLKKYEDKEMNFAEIVRNAPIAPSLEHGFGPMTPLSVYEQSEIDNALPLATSSPAM